VAILAALDQFPIGTTTEAAAVGAVEGFTALSDPQPARKMIPGKRTASL